MMKETCTKCGACLMVLSGRIPFLDATVEILDGNDTYVDCGDLVTDSYEDEEDEEEGDDDDSEVISRCDVEGVLYHSFSSEDFEVTIKFCPGCKKVVSLPSISKPV